MSQTGPESLPPPWHRIGYGDTDSEPTSGKIDERYGDTDQPRGSREPNDSFDGITTEELCDLAMKTGDPIDQKMIIDEIFRRSQRAKTAFYSGHISRDPWS